MNALIIDDFPNVINQIAQRLKDFPDINVNVVGKANNVDTALEQLKSNCVDVIFLDIMMPVPDDFQSSPKFQGLGGFELLKSLNLDEVPYVIFITGKKKLAKLTYNRHMEPHIKEKIIDYLPKALLSTEFFENAIKMTQQRLKVDNAMRSLPQIEDERNRAVRHLEEMTRITDQWRVSDVPDVPIKLKCNNGGVQLINSSDIYWFEKISGDMKICFLHNSQKREEDCLSSTKLNDFEKYLDDSIFFRTKNYRINLEKIKKLTKKENCLVVTLETEDASGIHWLEKEIEIIKRERQSQFLNKYITTRNENLRVTYYENKKEKVMEMKKQSIPSRNFLGRTWKSKIKCIEPI